MDTPTASPRTAPPTTPPVSAAPDSSPDSTGAGSSAPESAVGTTSTTLAPPLQPSEGDRTLLQFAESLELAARDLYQSAITAEVTGGDYEGVFLTLRENHEEYANAISGLVGASAVARSEDLFDQFSSSLTSSDVTELASSAYDLESLLLVTHSDLIGTLEGKDGASALAGAVTVIARQCSALAAIAGRIGDLDALLTSTASAMTPPAGSGSSTSGSSTPESSAAAER